MALSRSTISARSAAIACNPARGSRSLVALFQGAGRSFPTGARRAGGDDSCRRCSVGEEPFDVLDEQAGHLLGGVVPLCTTLPECLSVNIRQKRLKRRKKASIVPLDPRISPCRRCSIPEPTTASLNSPRKAGPPSVAISRGRAHMDQSLWAPENSARMPCRRRSCAAPTVEPAGRGANGLTLRPTMHFVATSIATVTMQRTVTLSPCSLFALSKARAVINRRTCLCSGRRLGDPFPSRPSQLGPSGRARRGHLPTGPYFFLARSGPR